MIQDALFAAPPATLAEPLGPCCKCGAPASVVLPNGKYIYCANCGKCGRYYIDRQTRCGISVEKFVMHKRLGIYVCPCMSEV